VALPDGAATEPELRTVTLEDLDTIAAIERASHARPWPREILRAGVSLKGSRAYVVAPTTGARPVAFLIARVLHDEVHVIDVATEPAHRATGYATRLLEWLASEARAAGVRVLRLEVRRSNAAAMGLYQSVGFRVVGVRPGYYVDDGEDALVMLLRLER
jgi:ribosomal-protein-alanine N-acetyltransferase